MLSYGIGLDIGITSVGWATVALDRDDSPYGIIGMGARIFDAAEQPKTGESLAAPRRAARSARRRTRRHRHRNERIRFLLEKEGIVSREDLAHLFDGKLPDIYALRVRALDESVSNAEFARILIHLAQRRGFLSSRKGNAAKENGVLLAAVTANSERMKALGYRTPAEMYLKDELYKEHTRNKGGRYLSTVGRDMVEDEVHQIFAAQRRCGNSAATEALESAYLEILLSQRSFDDGPGVNSPYAGNQIDRMIGKCTLIPTEKRAAKACYTFEYFSLLEAVNHIRLVSDKQSAALTAAQRASIIDLAHRTADLSYAKIRKELGLSGQITFNTVSYKNADKPDDAEKKAKFNHLRAYHQMRTAFDKLSKGHFADFSIDQRNILGDVLSRYKSTKNITKALQDAGFSDADIGVAETLSFSKFGHLSILACEKLIPYLEQGLKYNDACTAAGFDFKAQGKEEKSRLLPALDADAKDQLTSPVVLRAVSQTIKVVNAIIRERGCSPTYVKIELAREMAKDHYERNQIKKEQDGNRAKNEQLMQRIRDEYKKAAPTGLDLVKMKLFKEQDGVCAYSLKQMSQEHLFDAGYAEVDHIVPYSLCFDDSYKNKVLVLAKENRDKGNRLPLQYLSGKRREDFIVWVNSSVRDYKKRQRLLKEQITEEEEKSFLERNLQDTKTASRFLLNYINDNLEFAPFAGARTKHVTAVNGSVTAYMRKRWGISKVRANGDLHHAVDALVIACTTDGMIQRISQYAKYKETCYLQEVEQGFTVDKRTGEVIDRFPLPWPMFHTELNGRLSTNPFDFLRNLSLPLYATGEVVPQPLFVSRMPRRKVTGAAHLETIKSGKELEQGVFIVRKPLTALKLDKDGGIADYYNPDSDRLLYEALLARLLQFGGDGKKAFAEPFYKPKRDGTPGPLVNRVKLYEKTTLSVPVHGGKGAASNDSMVRIDVFRVEGEGYYFIPIYVADTIKPILPNKAVVKNVSKNPFEQWKEMSDDDFLFSLFPNDLVRITHKKGLKLKKAQEEADLPDSYEPKSEMLYFISANIATAAANFRTHDNSYLLTSCGLKTLESIEKYEVDVLGAYHPVRKEKRQGFHQKKEG